MSDNPVTESTPLNIETGAEAFMALMNPPEPAGEGDDAIPKEPAGDKEPGESEGEDAVVDEAGEPQKVTVKVDGKEIEVTLDELKNGYQAQAASTKRFMEAAETRKAAEAEISKAQQERAAYAQKLGEQNAVLSAALQEQNQIDWQQLLNTDPVEYLKQQHLFQQRQAALQRTQQEQQQVFQLQQAEQAKFVQKLVASQQEQLLAKVPEWKDEGKAKAEKTAIREFLKDEGYSDAEIAQASDHRAIIMARDAMRYRELMAKAKAAAKKVENLPGRVERPSNGTAPTVDKRSAAFTKLQKSGRVEDAAVIFASLI